MRDHGGGVALVVPCENHIENCINALQNGVECGMGNNGLTAVSYATDQIETLNQKETKMKNKLPIKFAGQDKWIARYGDEVWEIICDSIRLGKWFTVKDVLKFFPQWKYTTGARYINAVLQNVIAETNSDEVVKKRGHSYML